MEDASTGARGLAPRELPPSRSARCLVVMYHYVQDRAANPNGGVHALSVQQFRRQLAMLGERLEPVDWPTFIRWSIGRASISRNSFLLTFDDGLVDHAEIVAPILDELHLRGVFFTPGAVLAGDQLLSAHALHILLDHVSDDSILEAVHRWLHDHAELCRDSLDFDEAAARRLYHYETVRRASLKFMLSMVLPVDVRARVLDAVFREMLGDPVPWARRWYMCADQVRSLAAAGHTIGGHGFRHEPFARVDAERLVEEVRGSYQGLNELLGSGERPFSYPYGSFNHDVSAACTRAGFVQAFTTERAWSLEGTPRMRVPRVDTISVHEFLEGTCNTFSGKISVNS